MSTRSFICVSAMSPSFCPSRSCKLCRQASALTIDGAGAQQNHWQQKVEDQSCYSTRRCLDPRLLPTGGKEQPASKPLNTELDLRQFATFVATGASLLSIIKPSVRQSLRVAGESEIDGSKPVESQGCLLEGPLPVEMFDPVILFHFSVLSTIKTTDGQLLRFTRPCDGGPLYNCGSLSHRETA